MPRISQDQTQERHAFLLELFRSQPELSRQEAMDAFKAKFNATINLKTVTELREKAQAEKENDEAEETETEEPSHDEEQESSSEDAASRLKAAAGSETGNGAAAQPAKAKPAKGAKQKNVFVDASKEQLDFLQKVLGQLQEAGASNVRIDHSTDRWMVVVVDAK